MHLEALSGSIVYLDQFLTAGVVQTNFLVDGMDYTDIEALDFSHLYQQSLPGSAGAKIVGGPLAAAGDPTYCGLSANEMVPCSPSDGSDTVEGWDGVDRLEFNGANISENIDISANGARVRDAADVTMDLNDVEPIKFQALDGADNMVINDLSGTNVQASGIDSGGGDGQVDRVTVNGTADNEISSVFSSTGVTGISGTSAPVPIFHAETGDQLLVNGGAGNDTIDASSVPLGTITLTLDGGLGDDVLFGGQETSCCSARSEMM